MDAMPGKRRDGGIVGEIQGAGRGRFSMCGQDQIETERLGRLRRPQPRARRARQTRRRRERERKNMHFFRTGSRELVGPAVAKVRLLFGPFVREYRYTVYSPNEQAVWLVLFGILFGGFRF
jgi:hypothetical protein